MYKNFSGTGNLYSGQKVHYGSLQRIFFSIEIGTKNWKSWLEKKMARVKLRTAYYLPVTSLEVRKNITSIAIDT